MAERDRFELDLAAALRAYLEEAPTEVRPTELARQFATAYPHGRTSIGTWRFAAVPGLAWLVLLAALLAALVGGALLVGSQLQRRLPVVVPPVGQVDECPPGSTPDEPGPVDQVRPPSSGPMAFDRDSGKIVLVGIREPEAVDGRGSVETWTFDVCTNTWAEMHPASEPTFGFMAMLAYDTAARRSVLTSNTGGVYAYDLAADTWTRLASGTWTKPSVTTVGGVRLAYDSGAARVVALRVDPPHLMWSLASGADVWEPVDQNQVVWPAPNGTDAHILLAYDASVDRLVGYKGGQVLLFDLGTETWAPPGATSPPFGYGGYYSLGGEIAYDEAAQRTVLFSKGYVIAYDATADRWETLYGPASDGCGVRPVCRVQESMIYDPVNERLVIYGGNVHTGAVDPGWWGPSDDVLAFDTGTREWTVLLEASAPEPTP
jgi:hypothetical protein